ncbi:ATP dependent DNA ligase (plasmid) [Sphingobium sp. MI1205]|nr:ATP dependent DNA ligase [Sphingobium sp. MI1205]
MIGTLPFRSSSATIVGHGPEFFHKAEQLGLKGTASKLAVSRYRAGYSTSWLKIKAFAVEQFVIVGTEQGLGLLWRIARARRCTAWKMLAVPWSRSTRTSAIVSGQRSRASADQRRQWP